MPKQTEQKDNVNCGVFACCFLEALQNATLDLDFLDNERLKAKRNHIFKTIEGGADPINTYCCYADHRILITRKIMLTNAKIAQDFSILNAWKKTV